MNYRHRLKDELYSFSFVSRQCQSFLLPEKFYKTMTSVVTEDDKTTEDTQFNLGADFKGKANTTSTVIEIH